MPSLEEENENKRRLRHDAENLYFNFMVIININAFIVLFSRNDLPFLAIAIDFRRLLLCLRLFAFQLNRTDHLCWFIRKTQKTGDVIIPWKGKNSKRSKALRHSIMVGLKLRVMWYFHINGCGSSGWSELRKLSRDESSGISSSLRPLLCLETSILIISN